MQMEVLKSKIYRAKGTGTDLNFLASKATCQAKTFNAWLALPNKKNNPIT
jgi:hypothetical protein